MSESAFSLAGRVVVLTGGAGLLGRRHVHALAGAGARVVIADLDGAAAEQVATEVEGALAVGVDIRDRESVFALAEVVLATFGRVDALVNNAAVDPKFDRGAAERHVASFESYSLEAWNLSLAVNLTGAFLCAQAFLPALLESRGAIVNVSSIYGVVGPDQRIYDGGIKPPDYSVTKAALIGLTKYLASTYGHRGLRTNTLLLGGVRNEQGEGFVQRYSSRVPLGRMANPDEYGGALVFMLSDAASYMTGSTLTVDGGWTAW